MERTSPIRNNQNTLPPSDRFSKLIVTVIVSCIAYQILPRKFKMLGAGFTFTGGLYYFFGNSNCCKNLARGFFNSLGSTPSNRGSISERQREIVPVYVPVPQDGSSTNDPIYPPVSGGASTHTVKEDQHEEKRKKRGNSAPPSNDSSSSSSSSCSSSSSSRPPLYTGQVPLRPSDASAVRRTPTDPAIDPYHKDSGGYDEYEERRTEYGDNEGSWYMLDQSTTSEPQGAASHSVYKGASDDEYEEKR